MFKKYFFSEYDIRYIGNEFLKFGATEIKIRKLHSSKKSIDTGDIHIKKKLVPDAFAYRKHKETDPRPLFIGFAQVNGYKSTYKDTKSISFKIKGKVMLKKYIAQLGIR